MSTDLLVNSTTAGDQRDPSVAALPNGQFVAVWSSGGSVVGRTYNFDGTWATNEFTINQANVSGNSAPVVAAVGNSRIAVAWYNNAGDISARLFYHDGTPAGAEFTVNSVTTNLQLTPAISALADDGFVVTWVHQDGGNDLDVYARTYDQLGTPLTELVFVAAANNVNEIAPAVAGLPNGNYVVVWQDMGTADGSGSHIRAQLFTPGGAPVTGEFIVNTTTAGNQTDPAVTALPDGRFVVSWTDGTNVRARAFWSDATAIGNDFGLGIGHATESAITGLPNNFFAAWTEGPFGSGNIRGGHSNAAMNEFPLASTNAGHQHSPTIATLLDGRVVVMWTDSGQNPGDTSGDAVRGRILEVRQGAVDLTGSSLDDQLMGTTLADTIRGGGGHDFIWGGNGEDLLEGGVGNDTLNGAVHNDVLEGGPGSDVLDGGDGSDTASYSTSSAGVTVVLHTGQASGGDAQGDQLIAIEDLIGSAFADTLAGDDSNNVLEGGAGNDVLKGFGGYDWLIGGAGNDTLYGNAGSDNAVFSGNHSDYVGTVLSNGSVRVTDLRPGSPDGTDTLNGVEFVYFSNTALRLSSLDGLGIPALGDVLWRHDDGTIAIAGNHFNVIGRDWQIASTGDFDGDGSSDILFRWDDGNVLMSRASLFSGNYVLGQVPTTWQIRGTGDFDADGDADILWRHNDGQVVTWEMQDGAYVVNHNLGTVAATWQIAGTGDFDADGDADILWRHDSGQAVSWEMENGAFVTNHNLGSAPTTWRIAGTGDFDADGDADILWRHQEGQVVTWEMENGAFVTNHNVADVPTTWQVQGVRDFDSDGDADILWRHRDGDVVTWDMEDGNLLQTHNHGVVWNAWRIVGTGEFDLA